ncbi:MULTISPECIES: hypothetical protein [unclassified Chryseobacterium]|uniref:hypothetical protein n=1 Tax=unclassified Chryseobacterium TaxID=2593645 RepID=UPI00301A17C2
MKQYLTRVSQIYSAKNKLESAILELITANDRVLIEEKDLKTFKDGIVQQINFLNQEYSRSSPKKPSWYNAGASSKIKDYGISGVDCVAFYIYEIKNKYQIEDGK